MLQRQDRLHQSDQRPAADWVCPKLVLTDASTQRLPAAPYTWARLAVLDRVTDRGAGAVRLDHADGVGVHARRRQSRAVHRDLRVPRRRRDVLGVAVLVGGRAAHHGQDPVTVPQRVRQSLEQHHRATLDRHKAIRPDVERMAATGRREHALCGRRRTPLRLHQQCAAAS